MERHIRVSRSLNGRIVEESKERETMPWLVLYLVNRGEGIVRNPGGSCQSDGVFILNSDLSQIAVGVLSRCCNFFAMHKRSRCASQKRRDYKHSLSPLV